MADESVHVVNKPEFLEVSDGDVLIPISTSIPIENSSPSPVLPKTSTMEHLPRNNTTYIQHQIDLLKENQCLKNKI